MIGSPICTNCNQNDQVIHDSQAGNLVCSNCGLIVTHHLPDMSPERIFTEQGQIARHGMKVDYFKQDNNLGHQNSQQYHLYSYYKDKQYDQFCAQVRDFTFAAHMPGCINNKCFQIYEQVERSGTRFRKSQAAFVAAVVYIAAKQIQFDTSPQQCSYINQSNLEQMKKMYQKIMSILVEGQKQFEKQIKTLCEQLQLNTYIQQMAIKMAKKIKEENLIEVEQKVLSAITIYLAVHMIGNQHHKDKLTLLSKLAQVDYQTFYSTYQLVYQAIHQVIQPELFNQVNIPTQFII